MHRHTAADFLLDPFSRVPPPSLFLETLLQVTFDMFLRWYIIESGRHEVREAEKQAGRDRVVAAATADTIRRNSQLSQLSDDGSTFGATNPLIG